jgi:hypothetical protein
MQDRIRAPFLIAALACAGLAFAIEAGSSLAERFGVESPPGVGIPTMALIDGMLAFTLLLMVLGLVLSQELIGRFQGCATCVVSCLTILASIVAIFAALTLLMLMIGLIGSFFGIVIYVAVFGHFPRGTAASILALLLTLKVACGVLLPFANQRFVQRTGLLLLLITSIALNVVIAFLHDFVPGVLVSVTDAIAGIVVGIVALIWAIVLLIGGVIGIITALKPPSIGGEAATP